MSWGCRTCDDACRVWSPMVRELSEGVASHAGGIYITEGSVVHCLVQRPEQAQHEARRWWKMARRLCDVCGKQGRISRPTFPRCGLCSKRRYCDENCQRADWPRHQEACPLIHSMPVEAHPWLRKMEHEVLFAGIEVIEAESPGLSPEEISEQIQNRILPNLEDSSGSQFLRTL